MAQMQVTDTKIKPFMDYLETDLGQYRFVATVQKVCAFLAISFKEMGPRYATIFAEQSTQFKTAVAVLASHGCIISFNEACKARNEYTKPGIDVDSRRLWKLADKIVVAVSMIGFAISLVFERVLGWACILDAAHNVFALGMAVEDITCAVECERFEVNQEIVDEGRRNAACSAKQLNMMKAAKAVSSLLPVMIAATTVYTGVVLSPMVLAVNGVFGAFLAVGGDLYGNNMTVKVDFHSLPAHVQLAPA